MLARVPRLVGHAADGACKAWRWRGRSPPYYSRRTRGSSSCRRRVLLAGEPGPADGGSHGLRRACSRLMRARSSPTGGDNGGARGSSPCQPVGTSGARHAILPRRSRGSGRSVQPRRPSTDSSRAVALPLCAAGARRNSLRRAVANANTSSTRYSEDQHRFRLQSLHAELAHGYGRPAVSPRRRS
jgi:hypothetical protein